MVDGLERWKFWNPDSPRPVALKELEKLPKPAIAALIAAMQRWEKQQPHPNEMKSLGSGAAELRVAVDGQAFRLIFVQHQGYYWAICCFEKKSTKRKKVAKRDSERYEARITQFHQHPPVV